MRALIDIVTGYEGAIQDVEEDSSDDNIEALSLARAELMEVLHIAVEWERAIPEQVGQKDFQYETGAPKSDDQESI